MPNFDGQRQEIDEALARCHGDASRAVVPVGSRGRDIGIGRRDGRGGCGSDENWYNPFLMMAVGGDSDGDADGDADGGIGDERGVDGNEYRRSRRDEESRWVRCHRRIPRVPCTPPHSNHHVTN